MGKPEEWMIPDEVDLDDALGQAIGEAMGPERTDGDEFAAGVQERIDANAGRMSNLSGFARAAAAFVPPILLPKGMLQGGSVLGGATLKGSGWKAAPGFAAFPALVLVMLTFSLALLVQRIVVRGPQRFERSEAQKEVIAWWKRFFVPVGLVLIGLIWWGTHAPVDAVLMFVVFSIVSLVAILGSLARAGLATRREIGVRTGSFLINLMAYGYMLSGVVRTMELDQAWTGLIPAVLVAGAVWCLCMGVLDNATDKEKWYSWACIFSGAFVLTPLLLFFTYVGGRTGQEQVSREQALEYVDGGFRRHTNRPFNAGSIGSPAWYLGTDGGQAPNLRELENSIHDWIDLNPPSEDGKAGVNYLSLLDVAYLGLLRDDDLRLFRKDYSQRMLLESDKPLRSPRHDVMQTLIRQLEDPLTDSEADWVAGRVLRGAKEYPRYNGAEDLYFRMMILESLGKYGEVEELRDKAHAQLEATWAVQLDGSRACFVAGLESLEPSERVSEPRERLYFGWMPASDYSFRLMIRFGVPEVVDLALFDKYLEKIAMKYRTSDMYANHAQAAAMRSLLHSIHEWEDLPPPATLEKWSRYRLVLAVLVLSLFCVFVTMRTPKTVVEVEKGTATV